MGTGPEYWLRLQELYDLQVAERAHGVEIAKVKPWQDAAWLRATVTCVTALPRAIRA